MRQILFLLFLSCIFGGAYTTPAKTNSKHQAAVTFTSRGAVQIRAVEIPKEPLRADCYFLRGKKVSSKGKYGGHGKSALREPGFTLADMRLNFPKMREYIAN